MKVEYTETTKKYKDIKLPYYAKTLAHQFKVISKSRTIQISYIGDSDCSIQSLSYIPIYIFEPGILEIENSTAEEFNKEMDKVLNIFKSKS